MYSIQHYVIKFVSDLRQVGGFPRVLRFPLPVTNKSERHDIAEILLKRTLNIVPPANNWDDAFADRLLVPGDIIYSSSNQSFVTDMFY